MAKLFDVNDYHTSDSGYRGSDRDTDYTVVPSLETAAHDAAVADGLINNNAAKNSESKVKKAGLRRGKWTTEEELYANRLIQEFKSGLLPLTDGTTLRTFLSKLLNCDPMRISKKFVGQNCIGKQVFRRRQQDLDKLTADQVERCRRDLAELERKFLERVAQTNRSKSSSGGVKPLKDGKLYDENTGLVAPWMRQPDEFNDYNQHDSRGAYIHQVNVPNGTTMEPLESRGRSTTTTQQYLPRMNSSTASATAAQTSSSYAYDPSTQRSQMQQISTRNPMAAPGSQSHQQFGSSSYQIQPGQQALYDNQINSNKVGVIPSYHTAKAQSNSMNRQNENPSIYEKFPQRQDISYGQYNYGQKVLDRSQMNMHSNQGLNPVSNPINPMDRNSMRMASLDVLFSLEGIDMPQENHDHHFTENQNLQYHRPLDITGPNSGNIDINREASDLNLHSFLGWPSMSSLLNPDESNQPSVKVERSGMMSALSTAVLQELNNFVVPTSSHDGLANGSNNVNKRPFENLESTSGIEGNEANKRQAIADSRYGNANEDLMTHNPLGIKHEKISNEQYDDVGYSLEDDHNWSEARPHMIDKSSDNKSVTSTGGKSMGSQATTVNLTRPTMNNKPKIKALDDRDESHATAVELMSSALPSSFYQQIPRVAEKNPSVPTTSNQNSKDMKAKAPMKPNSKVIPSNSSVENFWLLVQMGDLPRPDNGILTESIWTAANPPPGTSQPLGYQDQSGKADLSASRSNTNKPMIPIVESDSISSNLENSSSNNMSANITTGTDRSFNALGSAMRPSNSLYPITTSSGDVESRNNSIASNLHIFSSNTNLTGYSNSDSKGSLSMDVDADISENPTLKI